MNIIKHFPRCFWIVSLVYTNCHKRSLFVSTKLKLNMSTVDKPNINKIFLCRDTLNGFRFDGISIFDLGYSRFEKNHRQDYWNYQRIVNILVGVYESNVILNEFYRKYKNKNYNWLKYIIKIKLKLKKYLETKEHLYSSHQILLLKVTRVVY